MVYIHIPYCRSFCTYCGFYSELFRRGTDGFVAALTREFEHRKDDSSGSPDTLYIGGGTPSVLPLSVLSQIVDLFGKNGKRHDFQEFTIEVNPEDIVSGGRAYVEGLLELGVNRVSMGIQSFDDKTLKWMNRRHDAAQGIEAYRILRESGVENISVDLIFGLGQDSLSWQRSIERLLVLPGGHPEHVSAYQLSVEEGSAIEKLISRGKFAEASEDICAAQYELLCRTLKEAGYQHYEVSNFALEGQEAVHNSAYWAGRPYLGLGPGAHSYSIADGRHVRRWNVASLEDWCREWGDGAAVRDGCEAFGQEQSGFEVLSQEQLRLERVMLSLRTAGGLKERELRDLAAKGAVDRLLDCGSLVRIPDGYIRIPEEKFFVSDSIIAELV